MCLLAIGYRRVPEAKVNQLLAGYGQGYKYGPQQGPTDTASRDIRPLAAPRAPLAPLITGAVTGGKKMKITKYVLAGAAVASLAVVGCTTTSVTPAHTTPPASHAPASHAPAQPSAAPTQSDKGPVGTTFTITHGSTVYDITATKVLDPAAPASEFDTAPSGSHLVGVEFVIKGTSGSDTGNANGNATMQGSNGQIYEATFGDIAAGTNFNSGNFNTSPGSSVTGWVNFEVPDGVSVSNIQWDASSGFGGTPATWTVGG